MATGIQQLPSSKLKIDLLWTNPYAAASSDPGGTYTIEGMNTYKLLIVEALPAASWYAYVTYLVPISEAVAKNTACHIERVSHTLSGGNQTYGERPFFIRENNVIDIGTGVYGNKTNNATGIIQTIRGIK